MKSMIIYDSFFGNTEKIAVAIGKALESQGETAVKHVRDARHEELQEVNLLIVGSPTRAFRPSPAISGFVKGMKNTSLKGIHVAAFDTRISPADTNSRFLSFMVKLFGYAAGPMASALVKKGGTQVAPPEGFFVKASEGPLKDGELERAAQWAKACMASQ